MKKTNAEGKRGRFRWGRIHLVDQCLLIILAILMFQSAFSLFIHETSSEETSTIDVVVRTSAAGIFGYLVSANFSQSKKRTRAPGGAPTAALSTGGEGSTPTALRNQIGFVTPASPMASGTADSLEAPPEAHTNCDRSQIIVVAAIGIVSLLVMLVFRDFMTATAATESTITQFRDFVSGSVGFLISSSTSHTDSKTAA